MMNVDLDQEIKNQLIELFEPPIPDFDINKYGNLDKSEWELSKKAYRNINLIYDSLDISGDGGLNVALNKIVQEKKGERSSFNEYDLIIDYLKGKEEIISHLEDYINKVIEKYYSLIGLMNKDLLRKEINNMDLERVAIQNYISFVYDAIDFGVDIKEVPKLIKEADNIYGPEIEIEYVNRNNSHRPKQWGVLVDKSKENFSKLLSEYIRKKEDEQKYEQEISLKNLNIYQLKDLFKNI